MKTIFSWIDFFPPAFEVWHWISMSIWDLDVLKTAWAFKFQTRLMINLLGVFMQRMLMSINILKYVSQVCDAVLYVSILAINMALVIILCSYLMVSLLWTTNMACLLPLGQLLSLMEILITVTAIISPCPTYILTLKEV